ncbi:MAG: ATP-binding protein [Thermoplasmata archaeon]|nr:ATP-binding protein [Thermoplasmata archaeon]
MYVERDIEAYFQRIIGLDKVIAIVGPRQAGKTTLLRNKISDSISYLLFDDVDVRSLFEEDVKGFQTRYLEGNDVTILDEIQSCKDAGINLKYLNDTGNRMWITSSSELLLGKEVLSYLVGRVSIIRLYPFSLSEFMRARKFLSSREIQVKRSLREVISYGGYPEVVLEKDPVLKSALLRNLYETMVLKDISRVFNINDTDALERSALYLSNMYTGLLSIESMSRDLSISFKTLKSYLSAMEKSYLIRRVQPFFSNANKELIKQPKLYFIDNGMRNVISGNIGMKIDGPSFENFVFTELIKLGYEPKYWRKKAGPEVDFVIQLGNEMVPIEVKLKVPENRVESALRSFIKMYSPKRAFVVIFEGEGGEVDVDGTLVSFMNPVKLRELLEYMK